MHDARVVCPVLRETSKSENRWHSQHMHAPHIALALSLLALITPSAAQAHATTERQLMQAPSASTREFVLDDGLPAKWCGTETSTDTPSAQSGSVVKVIYTYPADKPNRFAEAANYLQANVSVMSRYVAAESDWTKTLRFDMGTSCGAQYADITVVALPQARAAYVDEANRPVHTRINDDLRPLLPTGSAKQNYLIFADHIMSSGLHGEAVSLPNDDREGAWHEMGNLVANIYGPEQPLATYADGPVLSPRLMAHEVMHTLGAVQRTAPHAYAGEVGNLLMHCVGDGDLMCVPNGSAPSQGPPQSCEPFDYYIASRLDCGRDDYFNPAPVPGSYLDARWNIYRSSWLGSCADELAVACGTSRSLTRGAVKTEGAAEPTPLPTNRVRTTTLRRGKARLASVTTTATYAERTRLAVAVSPMRLPAGRYRVQVCVAVGSGPRRVSTTGVRCQAETKRVRKTRRITLRAARITTDAGPYLGGYVELTRNGKRYATSLDRKRPGLLAASAE